MINNDRYLDFCNNLALYLGCIINYETKLVYYGFESRKASVYISVKDITNKLTRDDIHKLCVDFRIREDDNRAHELGVSTVFEFKGIAEIETGDTVAMFDIDDIVLNRYRFSENLIKSLKTKNKFNL